LSEEWKESIIGPSYKKGDKTDYITYTLCQIRTKFYPILCCQPLLHMQGKLLEVISVDFDATGQLLILYSAFVKY
jgi:hypothetical protein